MKKSLTNATLACIIVSILSVSSCAFAEYIIDRELSKPATNRTEQLSKAEGDCRQSDYLPFTGMFIATEYIRETYDNFGQCYLVYDTQEPGRQYMHIPVDKKTHDDMVKCITSKHEKVGVLVINEDSVTYSFKAETL